MMPPQNLTGRTPKSQEGDPDHGPHEDAQRHSDPSRSTLGTQSVVCGAGRASVSPAWSSVAVAASGTTMTGQGASRGNFAATEPESGKRTPSAWAGADHDQSRLLACGGGLQTVNRGSAGHGAAVADVSRHDARCEVVGHFAARSRDALRGAVLDCKHDRGSQSIPSTPSRKLAARAALAYGGTHVSRRCWAEPGRRNARLYPCFRPGLLAEAGSHGVPPENARHARRHIGTPGRHLEARFRLVNGHASRAGGRSDAEQGRTLPAWGSRSCKRRAAQAVVVGPRTSLAPPGRAAFCWTVTDSLEGPSR